MISLRERVVMKVKVADKMTAAINLHKAATPAVQEAFWSRLTDLTLKMNDLDKLARADFKMAYYNWMAAFTTYELDIQRPYDPVKYISDPDVRATIEFSEQGNNVIKETIINMAGATLKVLLDRYMVIPEEICFRFENTEVAVTLLELQSDFYKLGELVEEPLGIAYHNWIAKVRVAEAQLIELEKIPHD